MRAEEPGRAQTGVGRKIDAPARDRENAERRLCFRREPDKFETIKVRHKYVGDEQVKPLLREQFHCFAAGSRANHFMPCQAETKPHRLPDFLVILGDKDGQWEGLAKRVRCLHEKELGTGLVGIHQSRFSQQKAEVSGDTFARERNFPFVRRNVCSPSDEPSRILDEQGQG